jgi:hypothetical protein
MADIAPDPMGGEGKTIEVDETYDGKLETPRKRNKYYPPVTRGGNRGPANKRAVLGLVERGGKVRAFHIANATADQVHDVIVTNASRKSALHTDEASIYVMVCKEFEKHETVKHSTNEYVRGDGHTNTVENVWSVFKRGTHGTYQHCGESHLHRYLAEFDFRYNYRMKLGYSDLDRAKLALKGIEGKCLTYRRPR